MSNDKNKPTPTPTPPPQSPRPLGGPTRPPGAPDIVRHEPGSSATPGQSATPEGAEKTVSLTPGTPRDDAAVRAATEDFQKAKARESGIAEPPSDSQKQPDEPRPNYLTVQGVPGAGAPADPLAGMPPEVIDALVARLAERMGGGGLVVPPGFKLVPAEPSQDAKSRAEQERFKAQAEKTTTQRSQEEVDRLFSALPTDAFWRVRLTDGNMHPVLVVPAATPVDAVARYNAACGVMSTDKKHSVSRVARRVVTEYTDWDDDEAERKTKPKKAKDE